ncbi:MAG TPA: hypothetical protein VHP30_14125 [Ignavibacteriales bacterium]|nr:hypothetical protein [Ignavibacteriales bacterium]
MRKLFYSAFAAIVIFTSVSFAQESRAGKFGIGYSGNFSKNSNSLSCTYWASDKFKIEPEVGVSYVKIDDTDGTNWSLGVGLLYTVSNMVVSPYLGFRVKNMAISTENASYNDLILTFAFGGEYFVSKWFSAGAEMRLNYIETDDSYSPYYGVANAVVFQTEQTVNFKIYFN